MNDPEIEDILKRHQTHSGLTDAQFSKHRTIVGHVRRDVQFLLIKLDEAYKQIEELEQPDQEPKSEQETKPKRNSKSKKKKKKDSFESVTGAGFQPDSISNVDEAAPPLSNINDEAGDYPTYADDDKNDQG